MEEIEKQIAVEFDGRKILLRYWAINYGTHVGSTVKFIDAATQASIVELSFETHWNAPGRYILRIGAVKENTSYEDTARLAATAGAQVLKLLAELFSTATSLAGVFARIDESAHAILWTAGAAMMESGRRSSGAS